MYRIAVIGDIHKAWNHEDVDYFNSSPYDLLLFVGDLPGRSHMGLLDIAAAISGVTKKALYIPGNHDGVSTIQLIAEVKQNEALIERSSRKQPRLCENLKNALGPVQMCGYSRHPFPEGDLDIIAVRPHSMGGPYFSYAPYLRDTFGVEDFKSSAEKIKTLIDEAGDRIIFFGHNGPTGLGSEREDIWGCDFRKTGGDFGDQDLEEAIEYALSRDKKVLGVIAGHMHHALKGKAGQRRWFTRRNSVSYVNAARVPRVFKENGQLHRHHIEFNIDENEVLVNEVLRNANKETRKSAIELNPTI